MTTPDFQTQLRVQLRDAARREERRGAFAPPTGWYRGLAPAVALAAVALVAIALVIGGLVRGSAPNRAASPKPVERFTVSPTLGAIANAFGSVWAVDPTGHLLQLDPRTHEVLGSIDIPPRALLGAAAGSLWAGGPDTGTTLRIDPKAGIVARIALRTPSGDPFVAEDVEFGDRLAWAAGLDGLLRIDLKRNVADRLVSLDAAGLVRGMVLDDRGLWVLARNDRLLRLDPRTGARRGSVAVSWPPGVALNSEQGVPIEWSPLTGRLARVDLASGRELWVRELGGNVNSWTVAGRDVWVHVSDGSTHDHVVRLDARTGRVLTKVQLPDLGVTSMAAVDGQLWVATPGGQIDVVTAAPRNQPSGQG